MLENFYDIETEDEEYERLVLKAQSFASEGRDIVAEAERQLGLLGPLLKENKEFVVYWSKELEEAQLQRDTAREAKCRAGLLECQQAVSSIQARITELEQVRASLLESLTFIRLKATHA